MLINKRINKLHHGAVSKFKQFPIATCKKTDFASNAKTIHYTFVQQFMNCGGWEFRMPQVALHNQY